MRRTMLVALILGVVAGLTPAGALPPAAGGALASGNVDFVARIPEPGAFGGRILGDVMYVTTTQGLRIFDVSNPATPLPIGALPLPHFGNEDVDTNGEILLIGTDHAFGINNTLYVIDVRNPHLPVLLARLEMGRNNRAHTASCILNCTYAYVLGDGHVAVVDLRDPANPVIAGRFYVDGSSDRDNPLGRFGISHDVNVDDTGIAWVSSGAGLFGYDPTTNPVNPTLVVARPNGTATSFNNNFIIHNSLRPNASAATATSLADGDVDEGELILVTEEDWVAAQNDLCYNDGAFQTGWVRTVNGQLEVHKIDEINLGQFGPLPSQKPMPLATCSSHYFDYRDGIAVVTWYEQGVRFFDLSNPFDITPAGYFLGADAQAVAALYHEDVIYVFDLVRGIDVIRYDASAPATLQMPPLRTSSALTFTTSAGFGLACRIPVAA